VELTDPTSWITRFTRSTADDYSLLARTTDVRTRQQLISFLCL